MTESFAKPLRNFKGVGMAIIQNKAEMFNQQSVESSLATDTRGTKETIQDQQINKGSPAEGTLSCYNRQWF